MINLPPLTDPGIRSLARMDNRCVLLLPSLILPSVNSIYVLRSQNFCDLLLTQFICSLNAKGPKVTAPQGKVSSTLMRMTPLPTM
jgi:hypothetical protein